MKGHRAIRRGTVVYDVANPRRHGIVRSLHLHNGKFCANVQWIEASWKSHRVPVAGLRRVTADTPSQPVRERRLSKPEYGRYDGHPKTPTIEYATYDGFPTRLASTGEIWCLFSRRDQRSTAKWSVPSRPTQVFCFEAGLLTEAEYRRIFGDDLPPLPADAFSDIRQQAKRRMRGWFSPLV